jgi:hypothetical protein
MKLNEHFKNGISYSAGVEKWCKDFYREISGGKKLEYTFTRDFAIADWLGVDYVEDTFNRVKKEWLGNYKAFTEVAISLNILSWANDAMRKQGIDDREEWIALYSELYYKARDIFYDHYSGNEEATDYFFDMTD